MPGPPEQVGADRKPVPVEIRKPETQPLELFQRLAGTLLPPIATAGIVILFVIFILLQREDLRDRLIRLFGTSNLQRSLGAEAFYSFKSSFLGKQTRQLAPSA